MTDVVATPAMIAPAESRAAAWSVVTIAREPPPVIRRFVAWHLAAGAARVTVYFDDPEDPCIDMLAHLQRVVAVPCTPAFWRGLGADAVTPFVKRQNLALTDGYRRHAGGWVVNLDADELIHAPGRAEPGDPGRVHADTGIAAPAPAGSGHARSGIEGAGLTGAGLAGAGLAGPGLAGAGLPGAGLADAGLPGAGLPGAGQSGFGVWLASLALEIRTVLIAPAERVLLDGAEAPLLFRLPMKSRHVRGYYGDDLHPAMFRNRGMMGHSVGKSALRAGLDYPIRQHFMATAPRKSVIDLQAGPADGVMVLHLLNTDYDDWRRKLDYRLERGSFRGQLSKRLAAARATAQADGDDAALRGLFARLQHATGDQRRFLRRKGLAVEPELDLPGLVARYFPDQAASGPNAAGFDAANPGCV